VAKKKALTPGQIQRQTLKEAYITAFIATGFNQTKALEAVGIKSRTTIFEWRKTDKRFSDALIEAREAEGDWYENQLKTLASGIPDVDKEKKLIGWKEKPDLGAIQTILNAKFKDRGYGYRIRHEIDDINKRESRIDLSRLTKDEREQWYSLLMKATIPDNEITDAEIIEER